MSEESSNRNIDKQDKDLPQWQMDLIDERLECIKRNPDSVLPIGGLFIELDAD